MLTPAEQYRSLVDLIDNPEQRYIRRMNENVVKPYVEYLNGLNRYLSESAMTPQQLKQVADQAEQSPEDVALPPQVKQNFARELDQVPMGPVQDFGQKAQAELAKVTDPEVKQSLLDKAKEALKNPDHQQTILTAISSIAGMVAGAATLGIGQHAAKAATRAIGNGLLGIVNAKMNGSSWKDAVKHGAGVGAAHAAADTLDVDARDAKKLAGVQTPTNGTSQTTPATTPQALKTEWDKFVQYGQNLVNKMAPAPATAE